MIRFMVELLARRQALRHLEARDRLAQEAVAMTRANPLERAINAFQEGAIEEGRHHWRSALELMPDYALRSKRVIDALLDSWSLDEVDHLLTLGSARFSGDPFFIQVAARLAEKRGDFHTAALLCRKHMDGAPDTFDSYLLAARCERRIGNLQAALVLLKRTIKYFPDQIEAWLELADLEEMLGYFTAALTTWAYTLQQWNDGTAALGVARVLAAQQRPAEVRVFLAKYYEQYKSKPENIEEAATLYERVGAVEDALQCRQDAVASFPLCPDSVINYARCLVTLRNSEAALKVTAEGVERFPENRELIELQFALEKIEFAPVSAPAKDLETHSKSS